jgi:Na+-driven multidrug efflux pump
MSAIIMNIILNYVVVKMHFGIVGVAMASAFTTFLVFIIFSILGMHYLENLKGLILFFVRVLSPLMLIIIEILLIERFICFANPILECLMRLLLFLICSLGVAFYINKRTGAINIIINILRDKFIKSKSV